MRFIRNIFFKKVLPIFIFTLNAKSRLYQIYNPFLFFFPSFFPDITEKKEGIICYFMKRVIDKKRSAEFEMLEQRFFISKTITSITEKEVGKVCYFLKKNHR